MYVQAHLGYKVTVDKVQPKVGKHKVKKVKNNKVLDPHRKSTKPHGPARPGLPGLRSSAALTDEKKVVLCFVHFPYPSVRRMSSVVKTFSSEQRMR